MAATAMTQSPLSRPLLHQNIYAPHTPSPLNPNPSPTGQAPPRPRRAARRHAKLSSVSSSPAPSAGGTSSSLSSARRVPRSITTTQRLLRRKAEEAIRVHNLYQHIQATADHQVQEAQPPPACSRPGLALPPAEPGVGDLGLVHIPIHDHHDCAARRQGHKVDEWSLDPEPSRRHGTVHLDLDLDQLERKLGMGWHEDDKPAQQPAGQDALEPGRFRIGAIMRRPTRSLLLAAVLVCLCGIPALRGQVFLRRAGTLTGSV